MKISILGSTKVGNVLSKEEAIDFGGKAAGICYMPETLDTLFSESQEKTLKRAKGTIASGHHSVYDHPVYNLALENIPKILAMILNNEKMYATSEKSARYTIMTPSEREEKLYRKWIDIYSEVISKEYPNIQEKQVKKLALENARYLISIFTPATVMEYTVNFRQLNYLVHWFEHYIQDEPDTLFNKKLKPVLSEFIAQVSEYIVPDINTDVKGRKLSIFDERKERQEEFGENYCVNYLATAAQFAQAMRHRTLSYSMSFLDKPQFYTPIIIRGTKYEEEWQKDISSLADLFPQGMLFNINERGTVENFVLKCQERLCGCAQLEVMLQTKATFDKYLSAVKGKNEEVYQYLLQYDKEARCKFKGWKCASSCIWGPNNALTRKI